MLSLPPHTWAIAKKKAFQFHQSDPFGMIPTYRPKAYVVLLMEGMLLSIHDLYVSIGWSYAT